MKTILTKLKYKDILFEKIQGYASIRHYVLPYLIGEDETLQDQLKIFNRMLKNNNLSSNFNKNILTFLSDRILFRIINNEESIFNDKLYFSEEKGEKNKFQKLKKRIINIYKGGKYKKEDYINMDDLEKYIPNDKEFALFIFDFLDNNEKAKMSLKGRKDINTFFTYYDKNKKKFQSIENENQISDNDSQSENIYSQMNRKPVINIAFIGNKNSGKSTTIGHLLYKTGKIDEDIIIKTRNLANKLRKNSLIYSWLINELYYEREKNQTATFHINKFETKKYDFNLIDLPGNFHYIKNIIKGISLADVAVVIVTAENENIEIENDHIQDYLIIAYTMGIRQLIIAINKMDQTKEETYSENQYIKIKNNMKNLCKKIGFIFENIQVIPYSGYTGQNLINKYEEDNQLNKMVWYKGKTLLECLDKLKVPKKSFDGPLKISIFSSEHISGVGTVLRGKILSGKLKNNMILSAINENDGLNTILLGSIQIHHRTVEEAIIGDIIGFRIKGYTKKDGNLMKLAFEENNTGNLQRANTLRVKIFIMNDNATLRVGSSFMFFCYTLNLPVKIVKMAYILDETDKIIEKDPKEICNQGYAIIIIQFMEKLIAVGWGKKHHKPNIYCEKYIDNPYFGSFILFNSGFLAVGKILEINPNSWQ